MSAQQNNQQQQQQPAAQAEQVVQPDCNAPECDNYSFEDSDRFEEDSLCSYSTEPESICNNWRGWKRPIANGSFGNGNSKKQNDGEYSISTFTFFEWNFVFFLFGCKCAHFQKFKWKLEKSGRISALAPWGFRPGGVTFFVASTLVTVYQNYSTRARKKNVCLFM